jgi:hypothetical protein
MFEFLNVLISPPFYPGRAAYAILNDLYIPRIKINSAVIIPIVVTIIIIVLKNYIKI